MAEPIIYSSEFRFYVDRVVSAQRRRGPDTINREAELIEGWLRQHGVRVVADFDRGSPVE